MSRYRTGRKNGHTIYWQEQDAPRDSDQFIGCAVTPDEAAELVELANEGLEQRTEDHEAPDVVIDDSPHSG